MDLEYKTDARPLDPLRQNILEAVDCLRLRKCRPDREAIAHFVLRKFGSTMNEIFAELEKIVDEGGLIKVEYKGTTSYRSPSNFDTKNSPLLTKHSKILNSSKTTRLILTGINELLAKDPSCMKLGVPLNELRVRLLEFDAERFGDDKMDIALEREKNCGTIFIAKSNILEDPLRVFPKDIPVPQGMMIVSLSIEVAAVKEEKKARKPRKSLLPSTAPVVAEQIDVPVKSEVNAPPANKRGRKPNLKKESLAVEETEVKVNIKEESKPSQVFAKKSVPPVIEAVAADDPDAEQTKVNKKPRLSSLGRKLVAEKVAEAVRNTYKGNPEFQSKNAEMVKLAGVVLKAPGDHTPKSKKGSSSVVLSDSSTKAIKKESTVSSNKNIIKEVIVPPKKRGRPTAVEKVITSSFDEAETVKQEESDSLTPSPNEQCLTRSKRDKRKRQVFDPSDLPKTYYSSNTPTNSSRSSRSTVKSSPSSEEPPSPSKKETLSRPSRTSPKKRKSSVPEASTKRVSRNSSKKSTNTDSTNDDEDEDEDEDDEPRTDLPEKAQPVMSSSTEEQKLKTDRVLDTGDKSVSIKHENGGIDAGISVSASKDESSSKSPEEVKTCEYCQESSKKAGLEDEDEFLTCTSCHANIHPSCMDYPEDLAQRIRDVGNGNGSRPWQCFDCKCCGICQQPLMSGLVCASQKTDSNITAAASIEQSISEMDEGAAAGIDKLQFILCEQCDVGFHASCTGEFLHDRTGNDTWTCKVCKELGTPKGSVEKDVAVKKEPDLLDSASGGRELRGKAKIQSNANSNDQGSRELRKRAKPNSNEDAVNEKKMKTPKTIVKEEPVDESVEETDFSDVTSWTFNDVEAYFVGKGMKEEAAILKDHEVDGFSLLLLRREDIVYSLGLRLGPALKVNRLIYEIQAKAPIRTKWNIQIRDKADDSTNPSLEN